jgi:hypothetical protein
MKRLITGLVLSLLSFVACSSFEQEQPGAPVQTAPPQMELREFSATADAAGEETAPQPAPVLLSATRMVIKTATLNCEVNDFEETLAHIQKIAAQYQGYIVSSSNHASDDNMKSGAITFRIASQYFETSLQDLKKSVRKVEGENVQGNDVTEEFYDLTARLENKKKAEKRYQEILSSARTTKDILEVEQALASVREEIERFEGRKRFLSDQVAMSTINVILHEPYPLMAAGNGGFLAKMRRGFELGIAGFADVLSACITLLIAGIPVFLLVFLAAVGFKKYRRRAKVGPSLTIENE